MRQPGWEKVLHRELQNVPPFEWGVSDCLIWVNDVTTKISGVDHLAGLIERSNIPWPRYRSAKGMKKALASSGYKTAVEFLSAAYGTPIKPSFAQRGDVVLTNLQGCDADRGLPALGICNGPYGVFKTMTGVLTVPMRQCILAWRVD